MNNLTIDCIAIDTNVFEHLLNPQENHGEHIDKLLTTLREDKISLIVDDKKRIINEYNNRIRTRIKESFEKGTKKSSLLKYWFVESVSNRTVVKIDFEDSTMVQIKKIINNNTPDSIFVYVAFKKNRNLVSNDSDITDKKVSLQSINSHSKILLSREAVCHL